jgi:hypothetical protein
MLQANLAILSVDPEASINWLHLNTEGEDFLDVLLNDEVGVDVPVSVDKETVVLGTIVPDILLVVGVLDGTILNGDELEVRVASHVDVVGNLDNARLELLELVGLELGLVFSDDEGLAVGSGGALENVGPDSSTV